MKEYKLSAKSKYSVCYLLCGLFMFFFMFAILSLSSHASAVSDYVLNINSSNGTFFETSGLYHSFSSTLQHPEYSYPITTVSGSSSFTRPSNVESINLEVHVVTSKGDFVVDTHQGTGSYEAFSSVKLDGYPIGYYGVCKGYLKEGTSSTTMTMNVSCSASVANQTTNVTQSLSSIQSNTNQILSIVGGTSSDNPSINNFSDYSTFSPLTLLSDVTFTGSFSSFESAKSGTPMLFNFQDLSNVTSLSFSTSYLSFVRQFQNTLLFSFTLSSTSRNPVSDLYLNLLDGDDAPSYLNFSLSDFHRVYLSSETVNGVTYYVYNYSLSVDLPFSSDVKFCKFNCGGTTSGIRYLSFAGYDCKKTISDYMQQQNDNWDTVNPSVIDTNNNTSQTVSDINTVNSFETTTFENFDTLADASGLTSFSLTSDTHTVAAMNFLSTCIVNVYNGFPSDLKWLIQCIGIFGIFALLLSVFGRVGKRINNE